MTEHDNRGKVSLWKRNSDNPKAPSYSGEAVAHRDIQEGEVLEIALWPNHSENPKAPQVTGKLTDRKEQQSKPAPKSAAQPEGPFEDDIPFRQRHWQS